MRALEAGAAHDAAIAEQARRDPLPAVVRALGGAIRDYHMLEVAGADARAARSAVGTSLVQALAQGDDALLALRALQLEGFLRELRRFEEDGVESDELMALGGRFVPSLTAAGWCVGRTILPGEPTRRAMFKEMWNGLVGVEAKPAFSLSLDEQRALYAFTLAHPHPTASMRAALDAARRGAHDAASCRALDEAERVAAEEWRIQRIDRLAEIDPAYPAAFARGVASYRRADYRAASAAFRRWLAAHPEGPLALRAQTFLRAAEAQVD
jgi:hypothetical protein